MLELKGKNYFFSHNSHSLYAVTKLNKKKLIVKKTIIFSYFSCHTDAVPTHDIYSNYI